MEQQQQQQQQKNPVLGTFTWKQEVAMELA
jgi:hypothetical protein